MVEGLEGRVALERSTMLYDRAKDTLRAAHYAILIPGFLAGVVVGLFFTPSLQDSTRLAVTLAILAPILTFLAIIYNPFFSIVSALTYLRARRASGESLKAVLERFEGEVLPESHWQLRVRSRIRSQIEASR